MKLVHAYRSVSDGLKVRKLMLFLRDVEQIPLEQRKKLLERYPDSSEEQRALGENLLMALDRLDDIKKPPILARFFSAHFKSEIDRLTFTRLVRALEKFNLELLPALRWYYTRQEPAVDTPEEIIHELSVAGLVTSWTRRLWCYWWRCDVPILGTWESVLVHWVRY